MHSVIPVHDITLGLLAGGRASRLSGIDKAWLERDGVPQVLRWSRRYAGEHGPVLVSANRHFDRYLEHGLLAVPDRMSGLGTTGTVGALGLTGSLSSMFPLNSIGPLGGLDALAQACTTPWLFTLPVDTVGTNDCLLRTLLSKRDRNGAYAVDDDGPQPLVALWRRDALRIACGDAIAACDYAVHRLAQRCELSAVVFSGFRFGNLNTPDDLRAAGFVFQETSSS
jgi:molybdenum cofactor guanylyltransferase